MKKSVKAILVVGALGIVASGAFRAMHKARYYRNLLSDVDLKDILPRLFPGTEWKIESNCHLSTMKKTLKYEIPCASDFLYSFPNAETVLKEYLAENHPGLGKLKLVVEFNPFQDELTEVEG